MRSPWIKPAACALALLSFTARSSGADPQVPVGDDSRAVPGTLQRDAATQSPQPPELWNLHAQLTDVVQYHPRFDSRYAGPNSLEAGDVRSNTVDVTFYLGLRLWTGAELYVDPEIDQGFGLSSTVGVAGFPSGEAYKVGANTPYARIHRAFVRQVFATGGTAQALAAGANQLAGTSASENITLTLGKFSVTDIFDTNTYAHDPRGDFLNWSIIDGGAFDYAADAWGYTYGAAAEWNEAQWTVRAGVFNLSVRPNSAKLEVDFSQYAVIGELEHRHAWWGEPGRIKLLGFLNHGRMGDYERALQQSTLAGGAAPDVATVRRWSSRPGIEINFEQAIDDRIAAFARLSANDGSKEAFEFTEINRSMSLGLSIKGGAWSRPQDNVGLAMAMNSLSGAARRYFGAGGLGILIGDGRLPHYDAERIAEAYYSLHVVEHLAVTADFQYIANPAYNSDRGPVPVVGLRAHVDF